MLKKLDILLSEALIAKGLVAKGDLDFLLKEADTSGENLAQMIIKKGLLPEKDILTLLSEKLGLLYVDTKDIAINKSVINKVPVKVASYYRFLPIEIKDKVLTLAVSWPLDIKVQDEIRMQLGLDIEMVLSPTDDILDGLKKYYGLAAETLEKIVAQVGEAESLAPEESSERIEDIEKLADDASVIKLVNQIILEGWRKRATDIHIEPYRESVVLRYRIDGILYDANVLPQMKNLLNAIISRIKIMSNLNIVERRLPQDGRAVVRVKDCVLDLRISTMPTPFGESVVVRILPTQMLFSLEKLGLSKIDLQAFEGIIQKPHGIIFVTGPTGSGKTTTLYTCLNRINTKDRKIITIEDPIEYEMVGITQIQVMPEIGLDFARGLRSILRHDPDVIMVGEVRDLETAEIAIRVALTGHLVFSTLHTNDAASGITRLIDIGVEPYLVSSSVQAFIAQRLIRLICPDCKYEDEKAPLELKEIIAKELGLKSMHEVKVYRGKGCPNCNFTGFFGRTAIYEILPIDELIKDLILKKTPSGSINRVAISRGMRTLRQDGWHKTISGFTTPEEVMRVTSVQEQPLAKLESIPHEYKFSDDVHRPLVLDKRVYPRLDTKVNLHYTIFDSEEALVKAGFKPEQFSVTKNISAGGVLFFSNGPLPVSAIIELKMDLPDGEGPIDCLARVVRVEEAGEVHLYNIGVCFLDITGAERARLNKFIEAEKT
jgi:type II secretory ATPase GspE/PulE/Tfp pilus assembly ATPase PilB-like protein